MRQYSQIADINRLAAEATLASPNKQATMFRGGSGLGITASNMGGNNSQTQPLANELAQKLAQQAGQSAYDHRVTIGGKRKKYKTIRRKKRTHRKKHNKRITRRNYKK